MHSNIKTSKEIESEVIRLYTTVTDNGWMGGKTIARKLGITDTTVQNILKRNDIPMRDYKESHSLGKRCKPIKDIPVDAPFCLCGCGQKTKWSRKKNRWEKYTSGHYHKETLYKKPEWLKSAYENQTVKQIAELFGVNISTIKMFMKKFGINARPQPETLKKFGLVRGERNPSWKGGVAKWDYSHDWKSLCKQIKERDKWTCQGCGEQRKRWGIHLHVHHKDGNKLNNSLSNLVSLCAQCHREVHAGKRMI